MTRRVIGMPRLDPPALFEPASHGRRGPTGRLSAAHLEAIARTVRGAPEAVVKVSGGARDARGVRAHLAYIDRGGQLALHTDDGRVLAGRDAAALLADEWNLALVAGQYRPAPARGARDSRPKVAHHLVLSMPGRTDAGAVLAAAQAFAREQFGEQHRWALALHTDQAHPHVHLVVKAEREDEPAQRLAVDRARLAQWREGFAAALRAQGLAANATPRQLRGVDRAVRADAVLRRARAVAEHARAAASGEAGGAAPMGSSLLRREVEAVARALQAGHLPAEPGKQALVAARERVRARWLATAEVLRAQGEEGLAAEVETFARALPAARTRRERIAERLAAGIAAQRAGDPVRAPPARAAEHGAR